MKSVRFFCPLSIGSVIEVALFGTETVGLDALGAEMHRGFYFSSY